MSSFLSDQRMQDLANGKLLDKKDSNSSKWIIYNNQSGLDLVERKKYNGLEIIETQEIYQHDDFKTLELKRKEWLGIWTKDYKDVWKQ
jgi:hypothetical protein